MITAHTTAVILLNFNQSELTLDCLEHLYALHTPPACICVVDNASSSADIQHLRDGWNTMRPAYRQFMQCGSTTSMLHPPAADVLLSLPVNEGFAAGNNAALRLLLPHPTYNAFWILNNDTLPTPDALDALCQRCNQDADIGLCGSTLVYTTDTTKVQAAGGGRYIPWTGQSNFVLQNTPISSVDKISAQQQNDVEKKLSYITGASCLVRREVLECTGLLHEQYFLYYEDTDFSLQTLQGGFTLAWAPNSIVPHKEGGSTHASSGATHTPPSRSAYIDYLTVRNRIALAKRWHPWTLPVLLCSLAGVFLHRLRRGQGARIPILCRAAWHGLRGKMGRGPATSLTNAR